MHYGSSCNSTELEEILNMLDDLIRNSLTFVHLILVISMLSMLQINEPYQNALKKLWIHMIYIVRKICGTKCKILLDHVWTKVLGNDLKYMLMITRPIIINICIFAIFNFQFINLCILKITTTITLSNTICNKHEWQLSNKELDWIIGLEPQTPSCLNTLQCPWPTLH